MATPQHTHTNKSMNTLIKSNLKFTKEKDRYYLNINSAKSLVKQLPLKKKLRIGCKTPIQGLTLRKTDTLNVIINDDFQCIICKEKAIKAILTKISDTHLSITFYVRGNVPLTKDHIIPVSKKGPDINTNYQCMCKKCNIEKGAMSNFKYLIKKGILEWDKTFKLNFFERIIFSLSYKLLS